jgi:hypothetical protein
MTFNKGLTAEVRREYLRLKKVAELLDTEHPGSRAARDARRALEAYAREHHDVRDDLPLGGEQG